ncbi:MAG: pilin [Patescibacteria group bacterium]
MNTITHIITSIQTVINLLVPVVFALAFIAFIFGIFRYFIAGGANEESRDKGKQLAIWGLVGFAIMVCVWGLVNLITGSLGLNSNTPCIPTLTGACKQGSGTVQNSTFAPSPAPSPAPNPVPSTVFPE